MGIGVLIVAVGLIYKKRDEIQKVFIGYKNKIIKNDRTSVNNLEYDLKDYIKSVGKTELE